MSIAQDLVHSASQSRKLTPKSIALGMALRQMTGSASVISLLSGLGHCVSNSFVLFHETALAQLNNSALPPGFAINMPTTLAWEYDGFCEETKSGKGTTYVTGGVIIQQLQTAPSSEEKRENVPRSRSLPAPATNINPYILGKRKTVNLKSALTGFKTEESAHTYSQVNSKKRIGFLPFERYGNRKGVP